MAEPDTSILDAEIDAANGGPAPGTDHWTGEFELEEPTKKLLSRFKTAEDAFKGYADLEAYKGRSISLPKEDATPEEKQKRLDEIYGKLGRPAKAEDYKVETPPEFPENMKWSPESIKEFKDVAYSVGLNQNQTDKIIKYYGQLQLQGLEMAQKAISESEDNRKAEEKAKTDKALTELKKEWGADFDKKMEGAEKAYAIYGKNLEERARLFYQIYLDKLREDTLIQGAAATSQGPADFFAYSQSMGKK